MKRILILFFTILTFAGYSQSAFVMQNLEPSTNINQVSVGTLYSAWKVTTTFEGSTDFKFPEINANLLWSLPSAGKLVLPVVGNIGFPLQDSVKSFTLGLHPYYIAKSTEKMNVVIHGAARYSSLSESIEGTQLQNFKVFGGIEVAFYTSAGLPFTISVTPAYIYQNLDRGNVTLLETTGIIPISKNLAAIVEGDFFFKKNNDPVFRVGLMTSKVFN